MDDPNATNETDHAMFWQRLTDAAKQYEEMPDWAKLPDDAPAEPEREG